MDTITRMLEQAGRCLETLELFAEKVIPRFR
jgi:hypothetical protein